MVALPHTNANVDGKNDLNAIVDSEIIENSIPIIDNGFPKNENSIQFIDKGFPKNENSIPIVDNLDSIEERAGASPAPTATAKIYTLGQIVGAYKSLVSSDCLAIFKKNNPGKMMGKLWQRNYYEIIVWDEQNYNRISDYIKNNPAKWNADKFCKG